MKEITALVSRNRKLFFKDKGMLFSSMITPVILIVLYATFLANVYKDSFVSATKDMIDLPDKIIDGTVAAQLAAALLAVSCVTVTFCVRCNICYIGYDSAGVIWKHAFKHCKLSAKDAGAVVGGWNNRKCRVWICVWCIHADI